MLPSARYRLYTTGQHYGCLLSGRTAGRDEVASLEASLCKFFDVSQAVCVPQARVGIYLALKHTITPGQRVILSPYTIADVVNMVICAGGVPTFADIDRQTCNISAAHVERLIDNDTGAVLITHLHGLAAPLREIRALCEKHSVPLMEDTAQAFGAELDGHRLGTQSTAGIVSFGAFKNITSWFGGAVLTNDHALAERIREELARWNDQPFCRVAKKALSALPKEIALMPAVFRALTFWVFRYGLLNDIEPINRLVKTELNTSRYDALPEVMKVRYTPMQARLVQDRLDRVDVDTDVRIDHARLYYEGLKDIPGLILPPPRFDRSHIYTYYPVQCDDAEGLLKHLAKHNRDVGMQHLRNCADLESFSAFAADCPNAHATARSVVLLPTYPRYGKQQVQATLEAVQQYFDQEGGTA